MFHPAMKNVAPIRKQIGMPTVFNVLGPLTNPARPEYQVLGVGKRELGPMYAELMKLRGKPAFIVHSTDGIDEISTAAPTDVWEVSGEPLAIKTFQIKPADFGVDEHPLSEVSGGTAAERVQWFRDVLDGKHGALRDFLIINAAAGLYAAGVHADFAAAGAAVKDAIDSGRAKTLVDEYVALTLKEGPELPAVPAVPVAPDIGLPNLTYTTAGGIVCSRTRNSVDPIVAVENMIDALDSHRGMLISSAYEYPGRYTMWDKAFVNPPVMISSNVDVFTVVALNGRGDVLLPAIEKALGSNDAIEKVTAGTDATTGRKTLAGTVAKSETRFTEEERSKQPSIFSVVRGVIDLFFSDKDTNLGLYGAFSYDLCFQFEKQLKQKHARDDDQRDIVLYIPDQILVVDQNKTISWQYDFEFEVENGGSTYGMPRDGEKLVFKGNPDAPATDDHPPGTYAAKVRKAKEKFKCGDLFETVLSQTFFRPCPAPPSELHRRLRKRNPAPYAFLISLGNNEWLVGASPEMYVRVQGDRVETCPISGTIRRGKDAIADEAQIRLLLNNKKEESELTMCTDVDRNDKSRICKPGSVKVLARRQIEKYSKLIHTVDHVEGRLLPDRDALDAFLCHAWAVTVTGAPKTWAMQFVEDNEESARCWYAGAVGGLQFDRNMDTGLTLRTIRIKDGVASVRAGATLLWDSDPDAEEEETRLKASAFLDALKIAHVGGDAAGETGAEEGDGGPKTHILLVDHEDSFVHTLANYIRQTGAKVTTLRTGFDHALVDELAPDIAVMSPGPGSPKDFDCAGTLALFEAKGIPVFGVCLGLQSMVEYFGGELAILGAPIHGKPFSIQHTQGESYTFDGISSPFTAARYHSLYAIKDKLPDVLKVTAETEDGIIMGIEHKTLPFAAVQFHPESILTAHTDGMQLLSNCIQHFLAAAKKPAAE